MMAVQGRCAVVDVAGSRRCGSTTCDVACYTGRIEVRSAPSVTERGGDCWYSPCMWMVPRRHSFVGQPGPAFVHRPGPTFVWRRGCRACVRAEVGARRHRLCVLRWALIVAVCACWCGAHVTVHPLVSLGLHLFVVLGPRLFRDEGTVHAC